MWMCHQGRDRVPATASVHLLAPFSCPLPAGARGSELLPPVVSQNRLCHPSARPGRGCAETGLGCAPRLPLLLGNPASGPYPLTGHVHACSFGDVSRTVLQKVSLPEGPVGTPHPGAGGSERCSGLWTWACPVPTLG